MRSIRRSLLGYFLALFALALGAVGACMDRFAVLAIQARETAETERTKHVFEARQKDAQAKFDGELAQEARSLAGELNRALRKVFQPPDPPRGPGPKGPDPKAGEPKSDPVPRPNPIGKARDAEAREYVWRAVGATVLPPTAGPAPAVLNVAMVNRGWSPLWSAVDSPRAAVRAQIPELLHKLFEEGDHAGFYQFNVVAATPGRPWQTVGVVRPARLAHDLPLDLDRVDDPGLESLPAEEVEIPDQGKFRRAVVWTALTPQGSRPLALPVWLGTQTYTPEPGGTPVSLFSGRFGGRPADFVIRVFVQAARPQAELDARFAADAAARDEELQKVQRETRAELARLRTRLGLIGAGSFLALVVGGWFIVARGLAPVRTLSDAVSRVSEKDFTLPVRPADLSVELAPIHARLTQTLDLLRAAFAREKEAVADISHELRTPIASILAAVDVTLRKPRQPEQYRATLEDCRGVARQLARLVDRIITLASLDAGTARGAVSRVDAADLARGCATVIRPLAEAHGLTFGLAAPGPAALDTDPDRLREVLMNLLHNAVEYNRPAGRVELAVRAGGDRVLFEVRDTGIGMTDEVKAKIFDRFFRADASRTATGAHDGLGLAIVREYVTRLGGAIDVDSTPGEGSLFRVSFPAARP